MARHPTAWQENVGAWFSPCRAEFALSLPPPAAQSWCCRREGGKTGTEGSGGAENSCPRKASLRRTDLERFIGSGQMEGASETEVCR